MNNRKSYLKIFLVILLFAVAFYLFSSRLKTSGPIMVIGDSGCRTETREALEYLKSGSLEHYRMAEKYIGVVECVEAGSGINVFERPPKFMAGLATREAGKEWYAGSIVHDACHVLLFEQYKKTHFFSSPPPSVWSGETAEMKCIVMQTEALREAGAPEWVFLSLDRAKTSKYWEGERWW